MATVTVNDTPIRYEDSGGDGPVIIFSHGFMMDHTMFDAQVAAFAGEYRCIRWDERGFGDTPSTGEFSYWDSADDAVAVLDACGVDQAISIDRARLFTDAVPDCRGVVVVDGAAHAPNMTHPEIVNDALATFLTSL